MTVEGSANDSSGIASARPARRRRVAAVTCLAALALAAGVGFGGHWFYWARQPRIVAGPGDGALSIAFSPGGDRMAVGTTGVSVVRMHDASSGTLLWSKDVSLGSSGGIFDVAFSPDGARLASAEFGGAIRIWDVQTGERLTVHGGPAHAVAFSPDGVRLAAGSWRGTFRIWSVSDDAVLVDVARGDRISDVIWLSGGELATAGTAGGTPWSGGVRIVSASDGAVLRTLAGQAGAEVGCLALSPDGTLLAGGDAGGSVFLWSPETGALVRSFRAHGPSLYGDGPAVHGIAFSPDGTLIATAGDWDNRVKVFRAADGELVAELETPSNAYDVAFSPDGGFLAAATDHALLWPRLLWRR